MVRSRQMWIVNLPVDTACKRTRQRSAEPRGHSPKSRQSRVPEARTQVCPQTGAREVQNVPISNGYARVGEEEKDRKVKREGGK